MNYLVVSEESLSTGPLSSGSTVTSDSSESVVGGVGEGEGSSVDGETKHDLPGGESSSDPVFDSGVLGKKGCYRM